MSGAHPGGGQHPNATALIAVVELTLETPQRILLDNVDLTLIRGRHTALVGRNGSGKSSLLAAIARRHGCAVTAYARVSGGSITVAAGTRCALLGQYPERGDDDATAMDFVDARAGAAAAAYRAYSAITADTARLGTAAGLREYGELAHAMDALDGWQYPERRDQVISGLGVDPQALERPLPSMSGGEITKLALAGALLAAPDVLLLDEPTNNLDVAATTFLAGWLRGSDAATLLVSHDRAFLEDAVDEVVEIGEHDAALRRYGGNYSFYIERTREDFAAATRQYEEQVARRAALTYSAGVLGRSAERFQSASSNDFYRARGKTVARRATVQLARVERQLGALEEPLPPRRPQIAVLQPPAREMRHLLRAGDLTIRAGSRVLLRDFSMSLDRGERVGIVGPNGSGKTTLLRVLLGELAPTAGTVEREPQARFIHLAQSVVPPAPDERVVDRVRRLAPISEVEARELLGKVVFTDVGDLPLAAFSAGERRRIELAVLFAGAPDAVVLDEATNHLDLPTIEMLEEALREYSGALLTVSHDRRHLDSIALHRVIAMPAATAG